MESRAKFLGHSIHQILIVFPLGLLSTSVVFDSIRLLGGDEKWSLAAHRMQGAGLISAMIAAPFGAIDWLAIPDGTRAKRIGAVHGLGNLMVAGLFGASWLVRRGNKHRVVLPFALSAAGGALAMATAWLGGELVATLGIGVYPDANADAPNSLTRSPIIDISIPTPGEGAADPHVAATPP